MICPYCGNLVSYNSYFDVFHCPKCGGFFKQAIVMKRNECDDLNKPLTLDDAIAHLDDTLSDTGRKWSCESCRMEHVQLRAWLAELRYIKRKRNAPLTMAELRKMGGEPVYSVEITGREEWLFRRDGGFADMYGEFTSDDFMSWDNYGKLWWCYRQKPEEDDHA